MLLKVVLSAYSRGLMSSRSIAQACVEHVTFIALSDDSQPHFITLAHFISTLGEVIASSIAFSLQRGRDGGFFYATRRRSGGVLGESFSVIEVYLFRTADAWPLQIRPAT